MGCASEHRSVRQIAQKHKGEEIGLLSRLFGRSHHNSHGTAVCEGDDLGRARDST
jgi:hypothetical protein